MYYWHHHRIDVSLLCHNLRTSISPDGNQQVTKHVKRDPRPRQRHNIIVANQGRQKVAGQESVRNEPTRPKICTSSTFKTLQHKSNLKGAINYSSQSFITWSSWPPFISYPQVPIYQHTSQSFSNSALLVTRTTYNHQLFPSYCHNRTGNRINHGIQQKPYVTHNLCMKSSVSTARQAFYNCIDCKRISLCKSVH